MFSFFEPFRARFISKLAKSDKTIQIFFVAKYQCGVPIKAKFAFLIFMPVYQVFGVKLFGVNIFALFSTDSTSA
jgi:hypothetical protein